MKEYFDCVRDSMITLMIGLTTAFLIFVGARWVTAQQQTPPMPPPSCQGELITAKQYNAILLNNTTNYETQAREFWTQLQDVTKKLEAAEAELKTLKPQPEAAKKE